jgi:AcrR family transcriptional regulator
MSVATQAESAPEPRIPLSRERVLRAAAKVADERGIESLTMRRLAEALGSEAMSLYYHVANKEDVLDGIVDLIATEINDVVDQIDVPSKGADWKKAARQRILSAREVLLRHPWAPRVFETRTNMSPAVVRYHDGLVGLMRVVRPGRGIWRRLQRRAGEHCRPGPAPGRHDDGDRPRRPGLHAGLV